MFADRWVGATLVVARMMRGGRLHDAGGRPHDEGGDKPRPYQRKCIA